MRALWVMLAIAAALLAGCRSGPEATEESDEVQSQSREYVELGAEYAAAGDLQQAELFLSRALSGFRSVDDQSGAARALLELARVYGESGLLEEAAARLEEAASIAEELGDESLQVEAATQGAELSLRRGDPEAALQELSAAEERLGAVENESEAQKLRAVVLHNRGVAYARQERFGTAHEALSAALEINREREALSEMASNRYMLASVESRRGDVDAALAHAEAALRHDKATENSARIALDLEALGSIHRKAGNLQRADDYFARAQGVYEALGARSGLVRILEARIGVAEAQDRGEQADALAQRLAGLRAGEQQAEREEARDDESSP
jgi:tetratricopeptide (TPR) repeat protein